MNTLYNKAFMTAFVFFTLASCISQGSSYYHQESYRLDPSEIIPENIFFEVFDKTISRLSLDRDRITHNNLYSMIYSHIFEAKVIIHENDEIALFYHDLSHIEGFLELGIMIDRNTKYQRDNVYEACINLNFSAWALKNAVIKSRALLQALDEYDYFRSYDEIEYDFSADYFFEDMDYKLLRKNTAEAEAEAVKELDKVTVKLDFMENNLW